jgi:dihydroorotase-like cyclic amidohydrolase
MAVTGGRVCDNGAVQSLTLGVTDGRITHIVDAGMDLDATGFESAGKNSPFDGKTLRDKPVYTFQRGVRIAENMHTVSDPGSG